MGHMISAETGGEVTARTEEGDAGDSHGPDSRCRAEPSRAERSRRQPRSCRDVVAQTMDSRIKESPERTFDLVLQVSCPAAEHEDPTVLWSFPQDHTDQ
ncbi:unnamed protein product, partial [Pleuronectes platessa]